MKTIGCVTSILIGAAMSLFGYGVILLGMMPRTTPPATTQPAATVAAKPAFAVQVVHCSWRLGGFGVVSLIHVTLKNLTDVPIGNIKYQTHYYAETGKQSGSFGGQGEIDKILKPGQTRVFEVNDGFVQTFKADKMSFQITDYEVIK